MTDEPAHPPSPWHVGHTYIHTSSPSSLSLTLAIHLNHTFSSSLFRSVNMNFMFEDLSGREHMFDKVVTPSDVGKLNRLVIPKQHAEKYFPLDSSANEKGLHLNFEDRNGKPWRFRYSYWNSSQSYVMTKGWSRFVKDNTLDAGDTVSFHRGIRDHRLFIDCRRRPTDLLHRHHFSSSSAFSFNNHYYGTAIVNGSPCPPASIMYLRGGGGGVLASPPQMPVQHNMVFESVPVVQGKVAAKRLRLFGVNMDCPFSSDSDNNDILVMSSSATTMMPSQYQAPFDSSSSSSSSSLAWLRHNDDIDKPKGSMSLDLDI